MDNPGELGFASKLSAEDRKSLTLYIDRHMRDMLKSDPMMRRLLGDLLRDAVRSEAVDETLRSIALKTGEIPDDALVKALTLYEVAIDAIGQGQRLVLLDNDYRYVRELTGLLPDLGAGVSQVKVSG